jgi:GH15 family glucan-1,4-alpha-glucosidase
MRQLGYVPIADYAVVGNKRSAALIALDGTIDWLCLPCFDDPSIFGAVLDPERGGRWELQPAIPFQAARRYIEGTNVLETTFVTECGSVVVRDTMTRGLSRPIAWSELVRQIEGIDGEVPMRSRVEPRCNFESLVPEFEQQDDVHIMRSGTLLLTLHPWACGRPELRDGGIDMEFTIGRRDRSLLLLSAFNDRPMALSDREDVERRVEETCEHWSGWIADVVYSGPWPEAVRRSALALQLMIHEPDASMIAAITTSLPERIGGDKNWDYRYAWVRDTTFAMDSLLRVGFPDQVQGMLTWLLHTARRTHPCVHTFYGLDGHIRDTAEQIDWAGYRNSKPVRVGNDAGSQLQLGNFGDILQTAWLFVRAGNRLDPESGQQLAEVVDLLCDLWRNEDSSIWELPDRRHYTQSKMTAWLGFHRALQLAGDGHIPAEHAARWRSEGDALRSFIDTECFDSKRGIWTRAPGDPGLDAATLLVAGMDYVEMDDPRLHATIDAIRDELGAGRGLLYRYTGMDAEEGCFLACSFWLAEALARAGRAAEAEQVMDEVVALSNDVGLFGEQFDPRTGEMLGNFPQALTHLSLITAAFEIEDARE